jgi:uncharacterized membrane protein
MVVLILGIVVFVAAHGFSTFREARAQAIGLVGLGVFKTLHALVSLIGLVLIVWGFHLYRQTGWIQLWTPAPWTRHAAMLLMWFAFVALACSNPAPGRIRGWLRHPMLVAVKIWALAHLLANGDFGGVVLFGSLLAWAVYDRIAVKRRGDAGAPRLAAFTRADAIDLAVGTVLYGAMLVLHPYVIGVAVLGG